MKVYRLRGLLLWEIAGVQVHVGATAFTASLVRPQWWQFKIRRYQHLLEVFLGPLAFIVFHPSLRSD